MADDYVASGILGGNPFSTIFGGNDKSLPQSMRQKIALAMLMQKRKAPTTFGEGLSAIGDSLGDIGIMRRMEREAADTEARGKALDPSILGGGTPAAPAAAKPTAYAPTEDEPVPVVPAAKPPPQIVVPPQQAPGNLPPTGAAGNTGQTTFAPPLQTTPAQRDEMLPGAVPPRQPGPQSAVQPPPGTPVMAFGGEPSENIPPPASSRDAVAAALMGQGSQPNPTLPTGRGQSADAFQQVAQAAPPPAIRTAPPDPTSQIQKAPRYEPDYVPPERPQAKLPPLTTPTIDRIQEAWRAAAPGDREMIQERYKDVIAREQAKVNQAHEIYKAQVIDDRAYELKRQEMLGTAAQRGLTAAESQRKLAKPDLEDIEGKMERDPVTGVWGPPKLATPQDPNAMPQVKMNKEQADNLTFYGWAGGANKNLKGKDELLAHGLQQELLGKVPVFGNQLQTAEYRRARTAANSFVLAFMRDTSGAAYGAKEMYDHASNFLPKQGDDPQTLADKAAARERFVQGKYAGLGQGGQRVAQWQDAQDAAKEQAVAAKSLTEVGRPGTRIGETVTSKKTGKQRVWDGKQWHDL
jgi:hypothetical protein